MTSAPSVSMVRATRFVLREKNVLFSEENSNTSVTSWYVQLKHVRLQIFDHHCYTEMAKQIV